MITEKYSYNVKVIARCSSSAKYNSKLSIYLFICINGYGDINKQPKINKLSAKSYPKKIHCESKIDNSNEEQSIWEHKISKLKHLWPCSLQI